MREITGERNSLLRNRLKQQQYVIQYRCRGAVEIVLSSCCNVTSAVVVARLVAGSVVVQQPAQQPAHGARILTADLVAWTAVRIARVKLLFYLKDSYIQKQKGKKSFRGEKILPLYDTFPTFCKDVWKITDFVV